jgi:phosphoribosylformimino-5-aminoimidazole carboxamide ribotide isomerase
VAVIASGGVGTLDDLRRLDRRLAGVIVGRAIYENRFTVEEGIAACSPSA